MDKIKEIIGDGEYNVELKKDVEFKNPKSYLKTVSSFANGNCIGYIIFGIESESKEIIGISSMKKSYKEIFTKIKTNIEPDLIPIMEIVNIDEKNVILLKIAPGNNTPYYYVHNGNKIAYIRKDDKDIIANKLELNELILKSKIKNN